MKTRLVSGIQPTGKLHIGNYLGALKNFVDLQNLNRYECFFFFADLHALTQHIPAKQQKENIITAAADFLAAGIDPKKAVIFQQSQVAAHTELAWVFNTITPMGELSRMTQFKDKSDKHGANAGLFTYPALMAADILLYDPKVVPVGEDQLQHLELTRMLAKKFNERYKRTFTLPKPLLTETARVMSLNDPTKKMSKSSPSGCLFLDDTPEGILKKVKRAVTDSDGEVRFDEKKKPAIANLLRLYKAIGNTTIKKLEKKYEGIGYGVFKQELAEAIIEHLEPMQERKKKLLANPDKITKILNAGSKKAKKVADAKYEAVRKTIGLSL